jgi:hypothetical protein
MPGRKVSALPLKVFPAVGLYLSSIPVQSDNPGAPQGLVHQAVGGMIIDKLAFNRIKIERPAQPERHYRHIDHSAGPETVFLVKREFLPAADGSGKIGYLRWRIGECFSFF